MKTALLLLLVCAVGPVRAEECECDPPMNEHVRDEIYAGVGLLAVGYTVGILAQVAVPASTAEYLMVRPLPVFGAIEAAARSGDDWSARMALVFSAGVQMIGILLATTSWAANRKVTANGNGLTVRF